MTFDISEEVLDILIAEALTETVHDLLEEDEDTIVDDFAGGNVDDAYDRGFTSGRVDAIRDVLKILGVKY